MGEAKRRKQLSSNHGKAQASKTILQKKVSPFTNKKGYLLTTEILKRHKYSHAFYYDYQNGVNATSILNAILEGISVNDWKKYFASERNKGFPDELIEFPCELIFVNIFSQANEIPVAIKNSSEGVEAVAWSEYQLDENTGTIMPDGYEEITIPLNGIIPQEIIERLKTDNTDCLHKGLGAMWSLTTIERLQTRRNIEQKLIEDWVKSGVDREIAELNIHIAKTEIIRKKGW